jgi:exonuclease VII large subunit
VVGDFGGGIGAERKVKGSFMKTLVMVLLVVAGLGAGAQAGDAGDPQDAELRMLRAAVKRNAESVQPLRDKILEQAKTINDLRSELDHRKKSSDQLADDSAKKQKSMEAKIAELTSELAKLKGLLTPSDAMAGIDGTVEISATQLETLGEKYVGKAVKMIHCNFSGASNTFVDELPNVTIASNGLQSVINRNELEKWIGFSVNDSNGRLFMRAFASKKDMGEFLATMKNGTVVNISGVVVKLDQAGSYGIVCDKIEIVPIVGDAKGRR